MAADKFMLSCQSGLLRGKRVEVSGSLQVGREANCALVLDDPKVSRFHGSFIVRDGKLFFSDNKSTNGTFINGDKITEREIMHGDVIKIGASEFALLEDDDFRTINFVQSASEVTGMVTTNSVKPDALAQKFSAIFDYYKEHQPEVSEAERYELVRTQRMLNSLKTLYSISQTMSKLVSLPELMKQISERLFEVFAGAENLVILLHDQEKKKLVTKFAACREPGREPVISISQTVLDRAVNERSTLIANDAAADSRLNHSESIIGFAVKSVMCAPLVSGENAIGALYLDNREANVKYDEMDAELLTAFANQCAIAIDNAFLCDSLQAHYHQTLQSLVNAIEAKDAYTSGHTARVSRYSVGIARAFGLPEKKVERIKLAADLHDIGKIGIKEGIINKAGKLTETEYSSIKDHVEMGEKILAPITYLHDVLPFIRGHHEKWDGTGYPDGLKGEACVLEARILALADAFDAMTSQRSYNKPMTFREALGKIKDVSGKHFDPGVVAAFEIYVNETLVKDELVATTDRKPILKANGVPSASSTMPVVSPAAAG